MTKRFLVESPPGTLTLVKTDGVLSDIYMGSDGSLTGYVGTCLRGHAATVQSDVGVGRSIS
jgi:hypothetical protein